MGQLELVLKFREVEEMRYLPSFLQILNLYSD